LGERVLEGFQRQQHAFVARLVITHRREGRIRLVRLARLAADRTLGVVPQRLDARGVAADRYGGQRRRRRLAEQAAAHLVAYFGDAPLPVELHVDDHAVAAQRVVAPGRLGGGRELARAGLCLGERDDAL